jgi:hypothetical protein
MPGWAASTIALADRHARPRRTTTVPVTVMPPRSCSVHSVEVPGTISAHEASTVISGGLDAHGARRQIVEARDTLGVGDGAARADAEVGRPAGRR